MFSAVTGHVHVKASIDIGCGKTPGSTNFDVKSDWGMDRLSPQQVIIRVAGLQHDFFPDPQKINSFHCHAENLCFFDEIMWPHAMMHLLVDISLHFRPAQVMVSERLQMARFFTKEIADSARVDILEYRQLFGEKENNVQAENFFFAFFLGMNPAFSILRDSCVDLALSYFSEISSTWHESNARNLKTLQKLQNDLIYKIEPSYMSALYWVSETWRSCIVSEVFADVIFDLYFNGPFHNATGRDYGKPFPLTLNNNIRISPEIVLAEINCRGLQVNDSGTRTLMQNIRMNMFFGARCLWPEISALRLDHAWHQHAIVDECYDHRINICKTKNINELTLEIIKFKDLFLDFIKNL